MIDAIDTLSEQQEEAGKAVQKNRLPKNLKCSECREPLYAEVQPTRNLWKCPECDFTFSEPVDGR